MNIGEGISSAIFSEDRQYRYALWRVWNREKTALIFIGLNPSTGDEIHDDPTICKLGWLAKDLGYGGIYIGNLFALRSSSPAALLLGSKLRVAKQSIGVENDKYLRELKRVAGIIVVGWGNLAQYSNRYKAVLDLLGKPVYCFAVTKAGQPSHPLYLQSPVELREYLPEPEPTLLRNC